MKVKCKAILERDIKYLNCYLIQDWWDGAEISHNGSEFEEVEEDGSNLPMLIPVTEEITKCKSLQKEKAFKMIIDLETGHILNWEQGYAMKIYWKIVDQGVYEYCDSNMNIIEKLDTDYCPNFLAIEEDGYGDYIIINIDENGNIQNWHSESYMQDELQEIMNNIFENKLEYGRY